MQAICGEGDVQEGGKGVHARAGVGVFSARGAERLDSRQLPHMAGLGRDLKLRPHLHARAPVVLRLRSRNAPTSACSPTREASATHRPPPSAPRGAARRRGARAAAQPALKRGVWAGGRVGVCAGAQGITPGSGAAYTEPVFSSGGDPKPAVSTARSRFHVDVVESEALRQLPSALGAHDSMKTGKERTSQ